MAGDIARDLAAAGRMADMDRILQVERVGDRRDVGGVAVHVVAGRGLAGAAMPAPVMRDDAIALGEEIEHLRVPVVGAERPAVMEHDGLPFAPVLVEDLDAVSGGDHAHGHLLRL